MALAGAFAGAALDFPLAGAAVLVFKFLFAPDLVAISNSSENVRVRSTVPRFRAIPGSRGLFPDPL